MRPIRRAAIALLALAALSVTGCAPSADPFASEPDAPMAYGSGAPITADDWSAMTAQWTEQDSELTYGVDLCIRPESHLTTVTLVSMTPYETVGEYEELPALLITGPDDRDAFISVTGYPPDLSAASTQEALEGAAFTHTCSDSGPFQLVAVGLRGTSTEGGGWRGTVLRYLADGREYTMNMPISFLLCGTSTTPCGPVLPSSG